MIPSFRQRFNANFTPEKYQTLLKTMEERCGTAVQFRLSETPCFFPESLLNGMAEDGKELVLQLVDNPGYRAKSSESIPPQFNMPNEAPHPMFVQVDFGLVRDQQGELQPKLVELQAFPSLYGYQTVLAQTYIDVFGLDRKLKYLLGGLDYKSYATLLRRAVIGDHDPENVILLEIDPLHQKTLPDFLVTEKMLGIKTVCITKVKKEGHRLYYEDQGKRIPIHRIYNRAIVDELERKGVQLNFDFRDDLDVSWAGHPNWYFRISKYSIPYLHHESVPKTWFLDKLDRVPDDLENYALKPLYSFAGLGVVIGPSPQDLAAIPADKRSQYILQERLQFEPVIETPHGATKAEIRIMYIWLDEMRPVMTIIRMGRGLQMGVDYNRNLEWVGSSAGLYP
ncbi:MAG: hypothetical protein DMG68_14535 [Acidobacteria bacterium]|nr:MAG: hypothetical protein DMG68_14535 [Acidobacteriota bacterium]